MSNEVLIIGSQRDYCNIIKEFLEVRDTRVTLLSDYTTGIDRLFEAKPALSVIEIIERGINPDLITKIEDSSEFSIPDFTSQNHDEQNRAKNQVLLFDDTSQINHLFDYLKENLPKVKKLGERELILDEGNLSHTFYPFLLIEIERSGKTGILSISSEPELKIYFKNGSPVYAEGDEKEGSIGHILLNSGRIDPETYSDILAKSKERNVEYGEVLIESGIITPHELNNILELQIEENISKGFCTTGGEYSFREETELPESIVEYNVKLARVLNEAVKRYVYAENIEDVNPGIKLSGKSESIISNMELKPKELRMVQLLKNQMPVKEILSQTRLEKYEALKLLYLLGLFEAIELPGASLEAIGRQSVERYMSEHKITAGSEKDDDMGTDTEDPLGSELKTSESDKEVDMGFTESQENTPADTEGYQDSGSQAHAYNQTPYETAGPADTEDNKIENDQDAPGLFPDNQDVSPEDKTGDPELEMKAESSEIEPPEEIVLNWSDASENELSSAQNDDATLNSGNTEEEHGESEEIGNAPDTRLSSQMGEAEQEQDSPLEFKAAREEMSTESEQELGTQETGPDSSTQSPHTQDGETAKDDTELFSTFENNVNVSEEPTQSEEQSEAASSVWPGNKDKNTVSGEEFAQTMLEFHNSLPEKDYYEILGVSRDASLEEIKDSYYQLVKNYHPDVNQNIPEDVSEKAQEIFTAINSAYETLSDSERRENYDSKEEITELEIQAQSIYEAEVEFKRGQTLLTQRDYTQAAAKFAQALEMNPNEAAYIGACAWARYLASEDKTEIADETVQELTRAIGINSSIAENYYYLGSIYKSLDDIKKAEQNYEKAVETDPNYIEAKRELRLINTRKRKNLRGRKDPKIEKRFWSGLFKK